MKVHNFHSPNASQTFLYFRLLAFPASTYSNPTVPNSASSGNAAASTNTDDGEESRFLETSNSFVYLQCTTMSAGLFKWWASVAPLDAVEEVPL